MAARARQMAEAARQEELVDFCGRLRRLRVEAGSPPLAWLSRHPRCPAKSQLSKIFRGQIRRLPDADVVRGIVTGCAQWAREHGHQPLLPTDERHWLVERDVVERRLDQAGRSTAGSAGRAGTTGGDGHLELHGAAAAKFTLPRDLATFTGRDEQLNAVITALDLTDAGTGDDRVIEIRSIDGMPGVGKTVFAVHVAHRLAERFPDGQYFVDLHGYSQGRRPLDPGDALEGLLLAVGVDPTAIPPGVDARAALWRDRMSAKTALLLLDNARDGEQVRPLLPASSRCLVLVTSRKRLTTLQDSYPLTLDVLTSEQAATLFLRLARPNDDDPASVADLMRLCGNLPLAISLLAGRLRHHPAWPLRYLVQRVTDTVTSTRDRLGEFRAENVAVAAAFEVSYRGLPAETQRLFRRLSLHTGPDIDAYAAAALDGSDPKSVLDRLERLYDDHLLSEYSPGRYRFHDLLRVYATELAALDDQAGNAAARRRLLDYYRWTTVGATALLPAFPEHRAPSTEMPPPAHAPVLPDRTVALEWLDTEHANLIVGTTGGDPPETAAVAIELHPYLRLRGRFGQAQSIYHNLLAAMNAADPCRAHLLIRLAVMQRLAGDYGAARENAGQALALFTDLGDRLGQAIALFELGYRAHLVFDLATARDALGRAYRLFTDLDDRRGQASALMLLGIVQRVDEDYGVARDTLTRARDLFVEIDDRFGQTTVLKELGILQRFTDDYLTAQDNLTRAYDLAVSIGDRHGQGNALMVLGWVYRLLGDHDAARDTLTRAYGITLDIGDRLGQANALNELGVLHWVLGDHEAARDALNRAHDTYLAIGVSFGRAEALRNLGSVEGATGDPRRGLEMVDTAYGQFVDIGDRIGQAEALCERGTLHHLAGDQDQARRDLDRARELFVEARSRNGEACVLNRLGAVELRQDHVDRALDHQCRALVLAEEIHLPIEQARAHDGIGNCHGVRGDHAEARAHHARAEEIYRRLGMPDRPGLDRRRPTMAGTSDANG